MKIFRLDDSTPKDGVGFGSTDLKYIQDGATEAFAALINLKLPFGYNQPVILDGIVVSKVGTNYTHSAGHIYYQGFIYTVDALTVQLASPSGSPKWKIQEVNAADNPVAFADGFTYNIDIDLKMILVISSASGTVISYDAIRRFEDIVFSKSKELYELITIPKLPSSSFITDYFDSSGLGIPFKKYEGFAIANGDNGTVDMAGVVAIGYNQKANAVTDVRTTSDYLLAAISNLVGKFKRQIDFGNLPTGTLVGGRPYSTTAGGFLPGGSGTGAFFDIDSANSNDAFDIRQPSRISIMIQKVTEIS